MPIPAPLRSALRSLLLRAAALACVGVPARGLAAQRPDGSADLAEAIRDRLEAAAITGRLTAFGEVLTSGTALPEFYRERAFAPGWVLGAAARADTLVEAVRAARTHGLRPADYHLDALAALVPRLGGGAEDLSETLLVDLDLLLTDAFIELGHHLLSGRLEPVGVDPEWLVPHHHGEPAALLAGALGGAGIAHALQGLAPPQAEYAALREALASLREVARTGGWPSVPVGPTLRVGERDPRVVAVRARLRAEGAWVVAPAPDPAPDEALFDGTLLAAVTHFQRRHGLETDGAVGAGTLAALNVPVEDRIAQVEVNLERWRWLPQRLGDRHIRVNIPGFRAEAYEDDRAVLRMRAIVGREFRETPVFFASMTHLVFAPYWHGPPTIAAEDKLPLIKGDPGYIAAQHMTLVSQESNRPVDPATVDWGSMTGSRFNREYRLRQDPGPWNALGDVKFMFPNPYNVYLHDTPTPELFERAQRDFSSGCMRIDQPMALARWLLGDRPEWTEERMRDVIAGARETTVLLDASVPVHVLYWTVFVDPELGVSFGADLYGRDARVQRGLAAAPPF